MLQDAVLRFDVDLSFSGLRFAGFLGKCTDVCVWNTHPHLRFIFVAMSLTHVLVYLGLAIAILAVIYVRRRTIKKNE